MPYSCLLNAFCFIWIDALSSYVIDLMAVNEDVHGCRSDLDDKPVSRLVHVRRRLVLVLTDMDSGRNFTVRTRRKTIIQYYLSIAFSVMSSSTFLWLLTILSGLLDTQIKSSKFKMVSDPLCIHCFVAFFTKVIRYSSNVVII